MAHDDRAQGSALRYTGIHNTPQQLYLEGFALGVNANELTFDTRTVRGRILYAGFAAGRNALSDALKESLAWERVMRDEPID